MSGVEEIYNYRKADATLATAGQPTEEQLCSVAREGAHQNKKVLAHCAANKRVTAFVGLYRTIKPGRPADKAFALVHSIWEPDPVWTAFMSEHLKRGFLLISYSPVQEFTYGH